MIEEMSGKWTLEAYAAHNEAMREIEQKFQAAEIKHLVQVVELNDLRYAEGNELRSVALKIKEAADAKALELASESQTYKEARNDVMREQNLKETGVYATRDDLSGVVESFKKALKPIEEYISSQIGANKGATLTKGTIFAVIAATGTIIGILVVLGNVFIKFG